MAECFFVINEVLFTVKNYFGHSPRVIILSIMTGFFTDDEILEARDVILSYAEKLEPKSDELKAIKNRTGSGKKKRETSDILTIYSVLDARKAVMLMFVVSNALRVPTFKPDDLDVCPIAASMQDLKAQMNDVKKSLQAVNDRFQSSAQSTQPAGTMSSNSTMAMATASMTNISQSSRASLAAQPVHPDAYQPVRRKVIGAVNSSSKLASSYKKDRLWHVFIGGRTRTPPWSSSANTLRRMEFNSHWCLNSPLMSNGRKRVLHLESHSTT